MSEDDQETLERIEEKVDKIQGDVNINTNINKMVNKGPVKDHFLQKLSSDTRRKIWYHATEKRTVEELAELADSSKSSVYNIAPEMNNDGLLNVERVDGSKHYFRNPTTEDIGLEREVKELIDDS